MCFIVDNKHPHRKIAEEDIRCYKVLKHKLFCIASPYQGMRYWIKSFVRTANLNLTKFAVQTANLNLTDIGGTCVITSGLHSYSTVTKAIDSINGNPRLWNNCRVHIAKIPKGTKYYYDSINNEYVSEDLIVYK